MPVVVVLVGLGFEEVEEGVEGVGGGDGFVLVEEAVEEPIAEGGGAYGEDVEAAGGWDGEANEGLAVGGGGDARAGDMEDGWQVHGST